MRNRTSYILMIRVLVAALAAVILSSCVPDPYGKYTYDPNGNVFLQRQQATQRYGHRGTHSPAAEAKRKRELARLQSKRRADAKRAEAKRRAAAKPKPKPKRRTEPEPRVARQRQEPRPEPKPKPLPDPDPEPVVASSSPPQLEIKPDPQPIDPSPEPEPTPEPPKPKPKPKPAETLAYGVPVPGKAGMVYSPYAKQSGYVDVRDIPTGTKVKCPYSGKVFRVP